MWANLRTSHVAWQFYARALGTNSTTRGTTYQTWINNFRTRTITTDMDTQLQQVCNMARDNNVIVFGIAFEAPTHGQTQIRNCSTDPNHYYQALGADGINAAFRSIAAQISQLRLTQ